MAWVDALKAANGDSSLTSIEMLNMDQRIFPRHELKRWKRPGELILDKDWNAESGPGDFNMTWVEALRVSQPPSNNDALPTLHASEYSAPVKEVELSKQARLYWSG